MMATGLQARRLARRASAPLALLVYNGFGDLGANPVETITNTTGIWTLRLHRR